MTKIGSEYPGMTSLAPVYASLSHTGKNITLKIHKNMRFQPNEKIFAESCSVKHKDFFWPKKFLGLGTLRSTSVRGFLLLAKKKNFSYATYNVVPGESHTYGSLICMHFSLANKILDCYFVN